MKLSDKVSTELQIPPGRSEILVFDDDLPNFGLRIRTGGKRTWVCQYRVGQKQRRVTLGNVANKSAAAARRDAKVMLAKVQLGQDPQIEKFTARENASKTLSSAIDLYLSTHGEHRLRPRSLVEVRHSLKVHWGPLGEVPMDQLSRSTISTRLDVIVKKSGPFAANRARAYLSGLFNWAIQRGYAEDNPVRLTGKPTAETSRDRVLSDVELSLIFRHAGSGEYGTIVRLLMLTGQRREEVGGMKWSELDLNASVWTITADRTKNGLAHSVPLSTLTKSILSELTPKKDRDLVFGSGTGPFAGWSHCKVALDKRINNALKVVDPQSEPLTPWRIHDLRRSAVTRMADHGVPPHIVEAIVNHISGTRAGVAGVYNRATYLPEKSKALEEWGEHLSQSTALS